MVDREGSSTGKSIIPSELLLTTGRQRARSIEPIRTDSGFEDPASAVSSGKQSPSIPGTHYRTSCSRLARASFQAAAIEFTIRRSYVQFRSDWRHHLHGQGANGKASKVLGRHQELRLLFSSQMRAFWAIAIGACLVVKPSPSQDGTSTLVGIVQDKSGVGILNADAELRPETVSARAYRTHADASGVFRFSGLPEDEYTFKVSSPYFLSLVIRSIHLLSGEQKAVPVLQLALGGMCWNDTPPWPEYDRLLAPGTRVGDLAGRVDIEPGATLSKPRRLAGAEVSLLCAEGIVCGKTTTDSRGEFVFKGLSPGRFSLRVVRVGFYPTSQSGYEVRKGLESHWLLPVERCPLGNCDPTLRPREPLAVCE